MLDLSILQDECLEIKMLDGEIINLKKPSQKIILIISSMDKKISAAQKKQDVESILNINVDRLSIILNNNKEKKVITKAMIEEFTPTTMAVITKEYMKWVQEINSNPN